MTRRYSSIKPVLTSNRANRVPPWASRYPPERSCLSRVEIADELASLPKNRAPTRQDWAKLSGNWGQRIDDRIAELERLKRGLTDCIGCGCLPLDRCRLANPGDQAAGLGSGPRYWLGDRPGVRNPVPLTLFRRRLRCPRRTRHRRPVHRRARDPAPSNRPHIPRGTLAGAGRPRRERCIRGAGRRPASSQGVGCRKPCSLMTWRLAGVLPSMGCLITLAVDQWSDRHGLCRSLPPEDHTGVT